MIFLLSCIGLLAAGLILYISFQIGDDIDSQVAQMIGFSILFLSFLFSPLWIKLLMVLLLVMVWFLIGDRLSLSFYRKLK